MTKVYRFHGPTELPLEAEAGPILLRKRKRVWTGDSTLVAADVSSITDAAGTRPIETFGETISSYIVTLTRREADLIALANPGVEPPSALEEIYPWLPHIPFLNESAASYKAAVSTVRRYGGHFETATAFCDEKWNTVCNSIRRRSPLDARFYTAWHLPLQSVHILEERRPDRSVVAIDFNAMYTACMQHPFPHPGSLRHVSFNRMLEEREDLELGLYRCLLEGPSTEFIWEYNPFRTFISGRRLLASLSEPVDVELNEFELDYYRRHFAHIHLLDAVVSRKAIPHPLAKEALRCFARRRNFRSQGNKALADREKFLSTLLSSCTSRPNRARRTFPTRDEALDHLRLAYGISPHADEPEVAVESWLQLSRGISLTNGADGFSVNGVDLQSGSACYLLGQRIVARGRTLLLEMMERVLAAAPDVQICYTNIDSIHFSLPTKHLDNTVAALRAEASEELGSFKIEAITRHGLWLEPGRYWLYSDSVEKFRNRSIGVRANAPFRDHAIRVTSRCIDNLHIPIRVNIRMDSSMSDVRTLEAQPGSGIVRQRLLEVRTDTSLARIQDLLEQNRQHATPARMKAFRELERRLSTSPRCLGAK
ncbi:hypothetical protein HUW63_04855 [Myxococcus sp. AM001]|nr:hypothetical protein [Myxococcus sp. AM001]